MKLTLTGLISFAIFISGCKQETVPYNIVFASDKGFLVENREQFPIESFKDDQENGKWTVSLDTIVYSTGNWDSGLKVDTWRYDLGQKQCEINYKIFHDTVTKFKISYPDNWSFATNRIEDALFLIGDSMESRQDNNKLFIVLAHNKKKVEQDLNSYNKYYNEVIKADSCLNSDSWIIRATTRDYYLNRFVTKENGEEILILNLNLETDSLIYDISYKTISIEQEEKFMRFFEMCLTARHGDFRLFNPLDIIKTVERVGQETTAPNKVHNQWQVLCRVLAVFI